MVDSLVLTSAALSALAVGLAAVAAGARFARWEVLTHRLARLAPPQLHDHLARAITRAGRLGALRPADVVARAALAWAAVTIAGAALALARGVAPAWSLPLGALAALLPFMRLRDQVARRHQAILRDLPYDLDLLTLSVEAGLDFTAAVQKVIDRGKRGPLRDELQTFVAALRMGKTRGDALESMVARVGLAELASVVSAVVQADRLGIGLARALRVQAEHLRHERFARAEARAGEAPVRMLVPLVLFVFPTLWIVLGAPLVFEYFFAGR